MEVLVRLLVYYLVLKKHSELVEIFITSFWLFSTGKSITQEGHLVKIVKQLLYVTDL